MKVELNETECQNVRVALRNLIKTPELAEEGMKQLLILSDKFVYEEAKTKVKKEKA